MDRPRTAHGLPTDCPRTAHGLPMELPDLMFLVLLAPSSATSAAHFRCMGFANAFSVRFLRPTWPEVAVLNPPRLHFGPPGSDSQTNFEQNPSEFAAKSFANILGNPNMRIAAYTVFYDTKRMSELGRGSPTPSQNPPECALKATIAFLLLLHRLWTLQNGPLGVSSGLMGLPRASSGGL